MKTAELRELPDEELLARLETNKEELFNLRFQSVTGQLDNPMRIKQVRHDIARILTVLRSRQTEEELIAAMIQVLILIEEVAAHHRVDERAVGPLGEARHVGAGERSEAHPLALGKDPGHRGRPHERADTHCGPTSPVSRPHPSLA